MKSKNYNLKIKSKILNSAISDASKNLNKITFHDEYTDYSNSLTYSSFKNNSNTIQKISSTKTPIGRTILPNNSNGDIWSPF